MKPTRTLSLAQSPSGPTGRQGFTLVEMLTVLTIIVCLCSVEFKGLFSSNKAASLTTAGNNISDLTFLARQQAISKNTPVALTLLTTDPSGTPGEAYKAFTLLELRSGVWVQLCGWTILPEGIMVDTNNTASTFLQNAAMPSFANDASQPLATFHGKSVSVTNCAVRVFLPSGGIWNPDQAAALQMVEGTLNGNQAQYQRRNSAGLPTNYYDVALLGVTGLSKVVRQ